MRVLICAVALLSLPVLSPDAATAQAPAQQQAKVVPPVQAEASQAESPALQPHGYTYNAEGRRDPFVTLIHRGAESPGTTTGPRPAGVAGLTAGELSLRGTLKSRDGFVAMLGGADNKTYLVRPGDKLFDGTIRTITADALVIAQKVSDPIAGDSTREVRKTLRSEEAK